MVTHLQVVIYDRVGYSAKSIRRIIEPVNLRFASPRRPVDFWHRHGDGLAQVTLEDPGGIGLPRFGITAIQTGIL